MTVHQPSALSTHIYLLRSCVIPLVLFALFQNVAAVVAVVAAMWTHSLAWWYSRRAHVSSWPTPPPSFAPRTTTSTSSSASCRTSTWVVCALHCVSSCRVAMRSFYNTAARFVCIILPPFVSCRVMLRRTVSCSGLGWVAFVSG